MEFSLKMEKRIYNIFQMEHFSSYYSLLFFQEKVKRNVAIDFAHVCTNTLDVDICTRLPQRIAQIYKQIELIIGKFTANFNNLRGKFIFLRNVKLFSFFKFLLSPDARERRVDAFTFSPIQKYLLSK